MAREHVQRSQVLQNKHLHLSNQKKPGEICCSCLESVFPECVFFQKANYPKIAFQQFKKRKNGLGDLAHWAHQ